MRELKLFAGVSLLALILAGQAQADALPTPAMAGPILANPSPMSFDSGFGKIYVSGAVSGLAMAQSNATHLTPGDASGIVDLSNALVSVQKTDGLVQFYVQAGLYSFPTVGQPYDKASDQNSAFGAVPVAYAKLQLSDTFSVEAGKLPTLVGAEYANTFQNMNIERGLLWWQEPVVSHGVQINYAKGPLSASLSWNDGYYSNVWNSFSGLVSYALDGSNTLAFDASVTPDSAATLGHQIYNLMYTYSAAPVVFGPYVQYETYDHAGGSEWGIGALASYTLTPNWSVAARAEYEGSSGSGSPFLYGPKSKAWSFTLTPTWQKGVVFARAEVSYAGLSDQTIGFGTAFNKDNQLRGLFEVGVVF